MIRIDVPLFYFSVGQNTVLAFIRLHNFSKHFTVKVGMPGQANNYTESCFLPAIMTNTSTI